MMQSDSPLINRSILAAARAADPKPESFEDRVLRELASISDRLAKLEIACAHPPIGDAAHEFMLHHAQAIRIALDAKLFSSYPGMLTSHVPVADDNDAATIAECEQRFKQFAITERDDRAQQIEALERLNQRQAWENNRPAIISQQQAINAANL